MLRRISNSSVGLIPLGNPIPGIVTSGLKWNLDGNQELSFGKLISTSNTFEQGADQVEIETKKKLLFTMEIRLNEFMST